MTGVIRLRKQLSAIDTPPSWPSSIRLAPVSAIDPADLHALLSASYANGSGTIPPLGEWWPGVIADDEYDPDLAFIATDTSSAPVGLALCWNSGFVKDLAVAGHMRGQGIGEALLRTVFTAFRQRGIVHVDLKVVANNAKAIRLYHRLGMIEAPL